MRLTIAASFLIPLLFSACGHDSNAGASGTASDPPAAPGQETGQQAGQSSTNSDRDRWQKPEVIIGLMGEIRGITIADLFAEDGYFAFKLVEAGANVIAVVNEPAKAEAINAEKQRRGLPDARLQVRTVPIGDPGIRGEEADMALIVHRFVGITDKRSFFQQMRAGLRYPRYLVMVEWQNRETPMGPPLSERLPSDRIMDIIGETTEYSDVGAHSDKVPDQVVFLINDYMDAGPESPEMIMTE